jgi:mersacidin/lichenicidin family type 2 lantibiotic
VVVALWKDPVRRAALGAAERAALPPHPAGEIELATEQPQ